MMYPEGYAGTWQHGGGGGINPFARESTHGMGGMGPGGMFGGGQYSSPFAAAAAEEHRRDLQYAQWLNFLDNQKPASATVTYQQGLLPEEWEMPVYQDGKLISGPPGSDHQSWLQNVADRAKGWALGPDQKFGWSDIPRYLMTLLKGPAGLLMAGGKILGGATIDSIRDRMASGGSGSSDLSEFFKSLGNSSGGLPEGFADSISGGPGGGGIGQGGYGGGPLDSGGGGGGGDPMQALLSAMYGRGGGYMGNPNIGAPSSWMMPVAGSNVGIPVIQGPSWVGPAFDPNKGY